MLSDGDTCFYCCELNSEWEVGIGTYTASGTTLARTTVLASSNSNNAVNFSAGTKNVFMPAPATLESFTGSTEISVPDLADAVRTNDVSAGALTYATLTRLLGMLNHICQGRLTLATGYPVYNPQPATPSSTDTSAETTTFATAHGWVTGTMVTPSATGGGLTAGTTYYLNATSTTACSYHTTLANAEAASSAVNLTASITAEIRPYGVQSTTVRFAPYNGNLISIYDGTRWRLYTFSELSLALGTLTSGLPYDVFVYDNSGTLTLELLAWTNGTTRATALVLQDGVYVKSGATTRRYLGTLYTVSTTATEDSFGGVIINVGGKRFVWNAYNRVRRSMVVIDTSDSWTWSTASYQQARANAGNKVEAVIGLAEAALLIYVSVTVGTVTSTSNAVVGIGEDSTSALALQCIAAQGAPTASGFATPSATLNKTAPLGYHYWAWIEKGHGSNTQTWFGDNGGVSQSGLTGSIEC